MAPPSFLNTSFAFSTASVTDVTTIMNDILTALTVTLSATPTLAWPNGQRWTVVSGTIYKSPVDAGGRFMVVALTRTAQTRLRFTISDPIGLLWDGEIQIAGVATTVEIYAGPGHLICQSNNAGTWEVARMWMTDPTPEVLGAAGVFVYAMTARLTTGAAPAGTPGSFRGIQYRYSGGALVAPSINIAALQGYAFPQMPAQDTGNTKLKTQAGSFVVSPFFTAVQSASGADNIQVGGRYYQTVVVDSSYAAGADITIPIDTGVTAVFRVSRMAADGARQYALRKA